MLVFVNSLIQSNSKFKLNYWGRNVLSISKYDPPQTKHGFTERREYASAYTAELHSGCLPPSAVLLPSHLEGCTNLYECREISFRLSAGLKLESSWHRANLQNTLWNYALVGIANCYIWNAQTNCWFAKINQNKVALTVTVKHHQPITALLDFLCLTAMAIDACCLSQEFKYQSTSFIFFYWLASWVHMHEYNHFGASE